MRMTDDHRRDLHMFSLKSQLRQARGDLRKAEREAIKARIQRDAHAKAVKHILLRAFRVVSCSRAFVDANAFGEGNTDVAWLALYESLCDFDEEIRERMGDEDTDDL